MSLIESISSPRFLGHAQFGIGILLGWYWRRILDKLYKKGRHQLLRQFAAFAIAVIAFAVIFFTTPADYTVLNLKRIFSGMLLGWALDWYYRARDIDPARAAADDGEDIKLPKTPSDVVGEFIGKTYTAVTRSCTNGKSVHYESVLTVLGAMAGFSCQFYIRELCVNSGKFSEEETFTVVATKDGGKYYCSDQQDDLLFGRSPSVWEMLTQALAAAGCAEFPDIEATARHVAQTIGTPDFGVSTAPPPHQPSLSAPGALKKFWPRLATAREKYIYGLEGGKGVTTLPFAFVRAATFAMTRAKDVVPPAIAGRIVFESAVAAAKIDPATLFPAPE